MSDSTAGTEAALRLCAVGKHAPLMLPSPGGAPDAPATIQLSQSVTGVLFAEIRLCRHCRLAYWNEPQISQVTT